MNNPLRWLALVALDQPHMPTSDMLAKYLEKHFSDPPSITPAGATDSLLTCTIGDDTAAITLVDRPIPWSQLEGSCATAWYWPDAAQQMRDRPAHLLVTLIDEGGRVIEKSMRLTQLVAALVANAPATGVFWGPSRTVHSPPAFLEQAQPMSSDDLPLFLWIDFRIEQTDNGLLRMYTTGLEAIGQTELEVDNFTGQAQALLEHAYNIAHYQLTQSKVINEGDTIGLTDELQVTAHRRPSMFDEQLEVIALEFQHAIK